MPAENLTAGSPAADDRTAAAAHPEIAQGGPTVSASTNRRSDHEPICCRCRPWPFARPGEQRTQQHDANTDPRASNRSAPVVPALPDQERRDQRIRKAWLYSSSPRQIVSMSRAPSRNA